MCPCRAITWSRGCTTTRVSAALGAYTEEQGKSYHCYSASECVCVWEKHIPQNWHSIMLQCFPKDAQKKRQRSVFLCLHTVLTEGFLRDEKGTMKYSAHCFSSDTSTRSLRSDKHTAIDHTILWCCVTAFELREPVNFAACELRLISKLEFDFRGHRDLILHHDPEGCVHARCSVPLGLTKGKRKSRSGGKVHL